MVKANEFHVSQVLPEPLDHVRCAIEYDNLVAGEGCLKQSDHLVSTSQVVFKDRDLQVSLRFTKSQTYCV